MEVEFVNTKFKIKKTPKHLFTELASGMSRNAMLKKKRDKLTNYLFKAETLAETEVLNPFGF